MDSYFENGTSDLSQLDQSIPKYLRDSCEVSEMNEYSKTFGLEWNVLWITSAWQYLVYLLQRMSQNELSLQILPKVSMYWDGALLWSLQSRFFFNVCGNAIGWPSPSRNMNYPLPLACLFLTATLPRLMAYKLPFRAIPDWMALPDPFHAFFLPIHITAKPLASMLESSAPLVAWGISYSSQWI